MTWALVAVFLGTAALYLRVRASGATGPIRLVKAIPALAAGALAADGRAAWALVFVLYAAGDLFLLDKKRFFVAGLGSFLAGHLLLIGLLGTYGVRPDPAGLGVGALLAAGMLAVLWRGLKGVLRLAVPVYAGALAGVLGMMLPLGSLGATGAAVFLLSDAILGFQAFRRPLPRGDEAVMVTYYVAIALMAWTLRAALPIS